jgi:SynChlorMet cassette radical SAM/SPASM protein ScmF
MTDNKDQLLDGIPALTTFYLYLTSGCNLACRHCWITPTFAKGDLETFAKGRLGADQYLDVDLLRQAVAEAKPLGLVSAKLTGGEPTLHPDFVKIVDLLTNEGLELFMETNGTLIDAELAHYLKEKTTLRHVSVSLDGDNANTHDSFRNVSGSFAAALRGLKNLVAAGFNPQVIMSIYRDNIHEVDSLVKLAVENGAGSVKFNPVTSGGRGLSMHEKGENLDFDGVLAFSRYMSGELQKRTPIPLFIGIPPALSTVGQLMDTGGQNGSCHVRNILGILGDGEMALCGIGRNVPELCFGRLGQDSIKETWVSHPTLVQLRKDLDGPYPDVCGDCIHATGCQTLCVANNYLDGGRLVVPTAMCAEAVSRGVFPDSRRIKSINSNIAA